MAYVRSPVVGRHRYGAPLAHHQLRSQRQRLGRRRISVRIVRLVARCQQPYKPRSYQEASASSARPANAEKAQISSTYHSSVDLNPGNTYLPPATFTVRLLLREALISMAYRG